MNKIILYLKKLGDKILDRIIPEDSLYAQVRKNVPPPSNKKIIEEGGFVMDSKTGFRKKQRMTGSSSLAAHYNEIRREAERKREIDSVKKFKAKEMRERKRERKRKLHKEHLEREKIQMYNIRHNDMSGDRGLKGLNSERNLLTAALGKNGLDIVLWKKLEVNLSETVDILMSEPEYANQEGREVLGDVNIRLGKVRLMLNELSGIANNYSNSRSQLCSVGTGGWGLGKCENQGIYQCPRCSKYCCASHKSGVRTYQGEPVCEPCSRGMQHT